MRLQYDGHVLTGTADSGDLVDMMVTEEENQTLTLNLTLNGKTIVLIKGMDQQVELQETSTREE